MSPAGLIAVKVAILVAAGLAASFCLGRSSAATRHALFVATLILALALPLFAMLLPSWPFFAAPWAAAASGESGSPAIGALPRMLAFIWLIGVLIILVRELFGQLELERTLRRAAPLRPGRWWASLDALRGMQPRRGMRVMESDAISSPCTWGALRPVLLLPVSGKGWSERQRRDALIHELAHINRFDYVSTLIGRLASALHWYNPLVWFAAAEARRLQEEACDECVVSAGGRASDYAAFLVSLSARPIAIGALAVARRSAMHRRLIAIFDARTSWRSSQYLALSMIGALAVTTLALASAGLTPAAEPPTDIQLLARGGKSPGTAATDEVQAGVDGMARTPMEILSSQGAAPSGMRSAPPPVPPVPPIPPVPPVPPVPPSPLAHL